MKARIFQKPKNAMQSGRAGTQRWFLEFAPAEARRADPLMGWAGSGDTQRQLTLNFPSLEDARAWADADPYVAAGVYARVEVRPFRKVLP